MICKRLEWYIESNRILPPYTSGFRKQQSCVDCVVRLVSEIQTGFTKNMNTVAVFLDVQNAYNEVLIHTLIMIMDNLKVGSHVCNYLWSFLSNRCLKIRDESGDETMTMARWSGRGLAQGDPLSPLLFNILTHRLCSGLTHVKALQYADDYVFYTQNSDIDRSILFLQNTLDSMVLRLNHFGLQASPTKTQWCSFRRGRGAPTATLTINKCQIERVECIKYLGIWLDKNLLWNRHINETRDKTAKMINMLKILAGASWGLHPTQLRRLYIALIRSRIDYSSFIYDTAAKTHLAKLDKVQNAAMRVIGGFICTTPIHVMESELCIQPLFLRRQYLATKYCLKLQSLSDNLTMHLLKKLSDCCNLRYWRHKKKPLLITVYGETKNEAIKNSKLLNMFTLDTWMSDININFIETEVEGIHQSKAECDSIIMRTNSLCMLNSKYHNYHKLFTDGSKTNNGCGAAFYDPSRNVEEKFRIRSNANCIMSVELFAISEALSYIIATSDINEVVILTDSRSALQHISRCASSKRSTNVAYAILKKVMVLLNRGVNLSLQWIPSHCGIRGNEVVDQLAKEAVSDGIEVFILAESSEILVKYKHKMYDIWKESFSKMCSKKGVWYSTIQPEPPRMPWWTGTKFKRHSIVVAHRLRSGHMPLNDFEYLMRRAESDACSLCGVSEDVFHLLVECVRSQSMRTYMLNEHGISRGDVGMFHGILAAPTCDAARALYAMVSEVLVRRKEDTPW